MSSSSGNTAYPLVWWWFTAGRCEGGACVEVASDHHGVAVRDSKDREGPILRFSRDEWATFLDGAKAGDFDHLR
jgi:uncharacterized protein DUF397